MNTNAMEKVAGLLRNMTSNEVVQIMSSLKSSGGFDDETLDKILLAAGNGLRMATINGELSSNSTCEETKTFTVPVPQNDHASADHHVEEKVVSGGQSGVRAAPIVEGGSIETNTTEALQVNACKKPTHSTNSEDIQSKLARIISCVILEEYRPMIVHITGRKKIRGIMSANAMQQICTLIARRHLTAELSELLLAYENCKTSAPEQPIAANRTQAHNLRRKIIAELRSIFEEISKISKKESSLGQKYLNYISGRRGLMDLKDLISLNDCDDILPLFFSRLPNSIIALAPQHIDRMVHELDVIQKAGGLYLEYACSYIFGLLNHKETVLLLATALANSKSAPKVANSNAKILVDCLIAYMDQIVSHIMGQPLTQQGIIQVQKYVPVIGAVLRHLEINFSEFEATPWYEDVREFKIEFSNAMDRHLLPVSGRLREAFNSISAMRNQDWLPSQTDLEYALESVKLLYLCKRFADTLAINQTVHALVKDCEEYVENRLDALESDARKYAREKPELLNRMIDHGTKLSAVIFGTSYGQSREKTLRAIMSR